MPTNEEIKILLMNLFKGTNNAELNDFLLCLRDTENRANAISNSAGFNKKDQYYHFKELNLSLCVTRKFKTSATPGYSDVSIVEYDDALTPASQITLNQKYGATQCMYSVGLEGRRIVVKRMSWYMSLNDNIQLSKGRVEEDYLILDIVNRSIDCPAYAQAAIPVLSNENTALSDTFGHALMSEGFIKDVMNQCLVDSEFNQAIQDCGFIHIAKPATAFYTVSRMLILYILNPSVKHLLAEEKGRLLMKSLNIREVDTTKLDKHFKPGNTFSEVLGIPDTYASYIRTAPEVNSIFSLKRLIQQLEFTGRFTPIDGDNLPKLMSLLPSGGNDISRWNRMLHVLSFGYSIDELYDYLNSNDLKEAVSPSGGLYSLINVARIHAFLGGKKEKVFPEYLSVAERIHLRDITAELQKWLENNDEKIRTNLLDFRKELEYEDATGFKITTTPDEVFNAMSEVDKNIFCQHILTGLDYLYYRKKRGNGFVRFNIRGQELHSTSEKFSPTIEQKVKDWAKQKNIYVADQIYVSKEGGN